MDNNTTVKIGLFGIGLDTYWDQFDGLKARLEDYQEQVRSKLASFQCEVVDAGLVDSVELAQVTGERFHAENVDVLFLFVTTYALSSTVLPVAQKVGVPVVILNLQPVAQLDYDAFNAMADRGEMTGVWLEHCQACSVPEIACVFNRAGIDYHLVSGYLDEDEAWDEIHDWVDASRVRKTMQNNRLGVLGHYYCGMLDVYSDMTQQSAVFGTHFEILEMCELHALREKVVTEDVTNEIDRFYREFDVSPNCSQNELVRAAKTSVALQRLVQSHRLGSMAYYYEGQPGNAYENIVTSMIPGNTLLTGEGVPVAGEYEIKNALCMKILDTLGIGGSFSELYLCDFKDDVIYLGHDGPAHLAIAESRVGLVPLPVYHGKPGNGLSIQMTVKHGPVTLLSIVQRRDGTLFFLIAEGESVHGPVLKIGNTNSRYSFPIGAKSFLNDWSKAGPAHHCAIGLGHVSSKLEKLAELLKIDAMKIC
ncbi:L-fucose/L-arabinose isomerase family protein [Cerasicoccus arenae]|uniref:L-arabinose isomerase n=1 Tax=Cerasicoccus arenae TaxID=424488 RepID=A0A8J3DCY9_9BACT|nr:L-fucose/L-arabinose isomerase family protein [Cerasicoccus arenae]MBK1858600.1 L-fucose/L-arabinose isomerase family protein [Cerasicoccus arenae]GHC05070.1 L-arabinose isomerase [Cerasicoccus arenae]